MPKEKKKKKNRITPLTKIKADKKKYTVMYGKQLSNNKSN